MSHHRFLIEKIENLDVDYQMLISYGKNEPTCRPKNTFFKCVISSYFSPFFIDHPVVWESTINPHWGIQAYEQWDEYCFDQIGTHIIYKAGVNVDRL